MSGHPKLLITGGSGFIGSHFVRLCLHKGYQVLNLDALTYAASQDTLQDCAHHPLYHFQKGLIQDPDFICSLLATFKPTAIVNFAAETHVDRSIDSPAPFIESNIRGSFILADESRSYYNKLSNDEKENFRFLHISTDEVFGSCPHDPYTEEAAYNPSSPYAASKAAADLVLKSYYHTYAFPLLITNCTNNYGPFQFPEKLIPLMIIRACAGQSLPLYGTGMQVRDWLYVEDHVEAILHVLQNGKLGNTYNIAGLKGEISNKVVVEEICAILDALQPRTPQASYRDLTTYVIDRPGHDFRYALDMSKIARELGWQPKTSFKEGLTKTVMWYLENRSWWEAIQGRGFQPHRLGLIK